MPCTVGQYTVTHKAIGISLTSSAHIRCSVLVRAEQRCFLFGCVLFITVAAAIP